MDFNDLNNLRKTIPGSVQPSADDGHNWLSDALGIGSGDPSNPTRDAVNANARNAAGFAGQSQGNYLQNQAGINQSIQALRDQAAGKNSVSAEQLRQGMLQGQAAQQSMAAGAAPNNSVMAARNAAMNMGRLGYGLAGQQAVAGLQERNQAQQALGQLQLGQSGQNLQGTLGGYGAANQGYGTALGNPQKGWGEILQGAIGGGASALVKSDRRAKTAIEDGDGEANRAIAGLRAFAYDYKNEKDGKGRQFGIMAQDLEKTSLKSAVIDTPNGKYVDGAKAALGGLGLVAALGRRVSKLEGK